MTFLAFLIRPDDTSDWITSDTRRGIMEQAGIESPERVNTPITRSNNVVAVVDDNSLETGRPNKMGRLLAGYIGEIAGNVIIISETMCYDDDDIGPGIDFVSLTKDGVDYIQRIAAAWKMGPIFPFTWPENINTPPEV
jgi:hypothetical protein